MHSFSRKTSLIVLNTVGLLLLSGCSNNIFFGDPTLDNETSEWVDDSWIPKQSQWPCKQETCPEKIIPDSEKVLSLSELVDMALNNNPKTSRSWSSARSAAFGYWASKSSYYPTIIANEQLVYSDNEGGPGVITSVPASPVPGVPVIDTEILAPKRTWSVTSDLALSYLLLDFGGRSANVAAARQGLYAANWSHNRVLQDVMLSVLQNYYFYISTKSLYEAQEADLKDAQTNLEAAKQLFNAGLVTRIDVLQAESNLVNTELSLVSTQGQIDVAYSSLATALGLQPDARFSVQDLPEQIPFDDIEKNVTCLMETAKQQRPDLAAAYALFLQSKANHAVAVSNSLPILSLNGDLQQINFLKYKKMNGHSYTGAISLTFPIFAGGYYRNTIKQAEEEMDVAAANFDDLEASILLEVSTSYYRYVTAVKSISFSDEYLKFAQDAYNFAIATYKEGTGTWLDVLSAQKTLQEARAQRISALTEWAISLTNIAYTTGVLYQAGVS